MTIQIGGARLSKLSSHAPVAPPEVRGAAATLGLRGLQSEDGATGTFTFQYENGSITACRTGQGPDLQIQNATVKLEGASHAISSQVIDIAQANAMCPLTSVESETRGGVLHSTYRFGNGIVYARGDQATQTVSGVWKRHADEGL